MPRPLRSLAAACLVAPLASGCMLFDCVTEGRSLLAEGTLGDSATAVVSQDARTPGRVLVTLNQLRGATEEHQVMIHLNYWSFADSVERVELVQASDAARVPIFSADASLGLAVRDTFFNMTPQRTTRAAVDHLRALIQGGDGMLVLHGHAGIPVAAKLHPVQMTGYRDACT